VRRRKPTLHAALGKVEKRRRRRRRRRRGEEGQGG